jgi:lipopolysaccharide/colanic/teichoic acid biosynthesis glycosyltransferase
MYKPIIKPFFDFCASFTAVVLLLPIYLVIYIVLRLSKTKEPLFYQPRPGKNEKVFQIIKFKTMTDEKNSEGELLPDDKRLTRIGLFLRKTSLDEIPQLINVLKGDMSLVGPRPLRVRYLPYYTLRENLRHTVKPGITGLAQVSGRNAISWDSRLELDAVYTEKMSFLFDCKTLFKTLVKVFDSSTIEFPDGPDSLDGYRKQKTKI